MGHYRSNVRDLEFNLLDVLRVQDAAGSMETEHDADTVRSILSEVAHMAHSLLADGFAPSDRQPAVYDSDAHTVTMPEDFARRFHQFWDAEWWRMFLPREMGGTGTPWTVRWAAFEHILGANPGVFFYMQCPPFAEVVYRNGTPEQQRWAQFMTELRWGATMVLTEAEAGSDVGAGRTTAELQPDGSWQLSGVKRFITSGEHDLAENIVHLVLARPLGHGPGTKGLSLFLVPKYLFDSETGRLGDRNGVFATNVEDKMGMKISATCELAFGQHGVPARGWLLGNVHDGIAQMFHIIAYARLLVAVKSVATLSTGYLTALDFAKERVQGVDLARLGDKSAPRVPIIDHPEVRRSLMSQKAYAEGLRALTLYVASLKDLTEAGGERAVQAERLCSFFLPIVKTAGAERASEQLNQALQILGGSGFMRDYPIEQYIRDARIDSLYEGTTAIQSIDLLFRQIVRDGGATLREAFGQVDALTGSLSAEGPLGREATLLAAARQDAEAMAGQLAEAVVASQSQPDAAYLAGQHSVRLLMALGDLFIAWQLLIHADVALRRLGEASTEADENYYRGKVHSARFFARTVLPRLAADREIVAAADNDLMTVSPSEF